MCINLQPSCPVDVKKDRIGTYVILIIALHHHSIDFCRQESLFRATGIGGASGDVVTGTYESMWANCGAWNYHYSRRASLYGLESLVHKNSDELE